MVLSKCTFDQLPKVMQMHVLYIQKMPVSQYRLAIWSEKDTLYYNDLKESGVKRFITLIKSEKRFLNNRTMDVTVQIGLRVYRADRTKTSWKRASAPSRSDFNGRVP